MRTPAHDLAVWLLLLAAGSTAVTARQLLKEAAISGEHIL